MTQKQYFLFLWLLSAMSSIVFIVWGTIESVSVGLMTFSLSSALISIGINGVALFFGIYFARNIGARLLLLDGQYNFLNDILNPAVLVGVLYAGAALIVNALIPINSVQKCLEIPSRALTDNLFFIKWFFLTDFFNFIRLDLFLLLFCISGLTFIIKKLAKNVPVSVVMLISAGLVGILIDGVGLFLFLVGSSPVGPSVLIDSLFTVVTYVLLTRIFWKKGLETALLCHVVIIAILRMIAPTVILALGA